MFIGHFAVGFACKAAAPKPSLGTYLVAGQLLDILWPVFLLLGWETVKVVPGITAVTPLDLEYYPWSHSLAMALVWSLLMTVGYGAWRKDWRGATFLGLAVFSHWVLDWITHRPDLQLYPGGATKVGLGLWYSLPGTLVVEVGLFAVGAWLYTRAAPARDARGRWVWWALVAALLVFYCAAIFGPPPPPNTTVLAISSEVLIWLLVAWGAWADRHRGAAAR